MFNLNPNQLGRITYPYVYWDNFFTKEDLDKIETYFDNKGVTEAEVINEDGTPLVRDIRKSKTNLIFVDNENEWIFQKLASISKFINDKFYGYDIFGFDQVQYTVYEQGDHYDYHIDMMLGDKVPDHMHFSRKLSFSLILTDDVDFQGGEFEIMVDSDSPIKAEQKRGRILAFPSFIVHRVKPVTSGVRKSIVFWTLGPKFK